MTDLLDAYLRSCPGGDTDEELEFSILCGDFNRHHPMWDEERNHHLFTATALAESVKLLEMVTRHDMQMVLPKDIPTLEALATKNWTHPDNIFCSMNMVDKIVYCTTDPRLRGPGTDHVPILTDRWSSSSPCTNYWSCPASTSGR